MHFSILFVEFRLQNAKGNKHFFFTFVLGSNTKEKKEYLLKKKIIAQLWLAKWQKQTNQQRKRQQQKTYYWLVLFVPCPCVNADIAKISEDIHWLSKLLYFKDKVKEKMKHDLLGD